MRIEVLGLEGSQPQPLEGRGHGVSVLPCVRSLRVFGRNQHSLSRDGRTNQAHSVGISFTSGLPEMRLGRVRDFRCSITRLVGWN